MKSRRSLNLLEICKDKRTCPKYIKKCIEAAVREASGQRVVRFYDPDKHIIEVGENVKVVCRRLLSSGMTPGQVSERMDVPMKFVNGCMR